MMNPSLLAAFLIIFAGAARAEIELPPNPPGFNFSSITDGASGAATGVSRSPAYDAPVGQGQGIDTPTIQILVVKDSLTTQTNDAPVRAWHGAMAAQTQPQQIPLTGGTVIFVTPQLISVSGVVDIEELSRAIALRRTTIPPPAMLPPPMPAGTNTTATATMRAMNTPYRETPAQRAQRMFFEHGGQKGRKK